MRKYMREYERMLELIGCRIDRIEYGKHIKVRLILPDGHCLLNVIPKSPSDCHWVDANRQLIQRVIRENQIKDNPRSTNQ